MSRLRTTLCLLTLLAWGCVPETQEVAPESEAAAAPSPESDAQDGPAGARRAPDAALLTLEGTEVTLGALRGDVAIVNFWGTWCLPCRTELPELAALQEAYRERGVRVIGIAIDSGSADDIRDFASEYGVDYELWTADMATAVAEFGAVGYPFTLLVDRDGWIRKEYLGAQTLETLSRDLDPLLE